MPSRRRNKNKLKTIAQKKAITARLMAISLIVDKYFYKKKPISISQAESYLTELNLFKTQCLGDVHSLQVCEKLTRFMKGIIEEQQSENNMLGGGTENTFMEFDSNNLTAASPVYSLADSDITLIEGSEPDAQPVNSKPCNKNKTSCKSDKEHDLKKTVRFSIYDPTQNYNEIHLTGNKTHNLTTEVCEISRSLKKNQHKKIDNELTDAIVDLTLEDINRLNNFDEDLCSQSLLKNLETTETLNTIDVYNIHDTCGQGMEEYNRETIHLAENKDLNYNKNTEPCNNMTQNATTEETQDIIQVPKLPKKSKKHDKSVETRRTVNDTRIPTKDVKVQKKKTIKKKNKENTPQTKRQNKKQDKKLAVNNNINVSLTDTDGLTRLTNSEALQTTRHAMNKSNNCDISQQVETNTVLQLSLNIQGSATNTHSHIQNAGILTMRPHIAEDLSWVENLTYVREIHVEEYELTSKPYSESFWENCELPNNWDVRDFEWT